MCGSRLCALLCQYVAVVAVCLCVCVAFRVCVCQGVSWCAALVLVGLCVCVCVCAVGSEAIEGREAHHRVLDVQVGPGPHQHLDGVGLAILTGEHQGRHAILHSREPQEDEVRMAGGWGGVLWGDHGGWWLMVMVSGAGVGWGMVG